MLSDSVSNKLEHTRTARGFVTAAVSLFDEAVNRLINRVFRKTDFAVKSVVDSLFDTSGPLADPLVQQKVLLGLGVITQPVFDDLRRFAEWKDRLNNDEKEYDFGDGIITEFASELNFLPQPLPPDIDHTQPTDGLLYQIKQQRREKLLRSCLILAATALYERLDVDSPL